VSYSLSTAGEVEEERKRRREREKGGERVDLRGKTRKLGAAELVLNNRLS
jgi:hypothetical protein